jgi:hypothetical protein
MTPEEQQTLYRKAGTAAAMLRKNESPVLQRLGAELDGALVPLIRDIGNPPPRLEPEIEYAPAFPVPVDPPRPWWRLLRDFAGI